MLTQYLRGRNLTVDSYLMFKNEYTYCHEVNSRGYRSIVGGCTEKGYVLAFPLPESVEYGIAAVQRLSSRI